jgi:hypothetical protein
MNIITLFLNILSWLFLGYFLLAWILATSLNLRYKTTGHSVKSWAVVTALIALSYLIAYHFSA